MLNTNMKRDFLLGFPLISIKKNLTPKVYVVYGVGAKQRHRTHHIKSVESKTRNQKNTTSIAQVHILLDRYFRSYFRSFKDKINYEAMIYVNLCPLYNNKRLVTDRTFKAICGNNVKFISISISIN